MARKLSLKSFYGDHVSEMPSLDPAINQEADEVQGWEDTVEFFEPQFDSNASYPAPGDSTYASPVDHGFPDDIDNPDDDDSSPIARSFPGMDQPVVLSPPSPTSATARIQAERAAAAAQAAARAGVTRGRLSRWAGVSSIGRLGYYAHDGNTPVSPSGLVWGDNDRFQVGINEDADEAGVNIPGSLADDNLGPNPDSMPIPRSGKLGRFGRLARYGAAGSFRGLGDVSASGVASVAVPLPGLWGILEMATLGYVAFTGLGGSPEMRKAARIAAGVLLVNDVLGLLNSAPVAPQVAPGG